MQIKILPEIKSPADIRNFSDNKLQQLANELRFHIIDVISEIGGHLAPTLGVVELTVAIHKVFNTPNDKIHQLRVANLRPKPSTVNPARFCF